MKLKEFRFLAVILFLVSCSTQTEEVKSEEENNDSKTRYTFSQAQSLDFSVAGGSYFVLYDYSVPIDTLFGYSGAFNIGNDSIIYARVRRNKPTPYPEDNEGYHGSVMGLFLFDGSSFIQLDLPDFTPYFSSFIVKDRVIYYWGIEKGSWACKYDLRTKKHNKILLQDRPDGTDFFGHFSPPRFDQKGRLKFQIEYSKTSWLIDPVSFQFTSNGSPLNKLFDSFVVDK